MSPIFAILVPIAAIALLIRIGLRDLKIQKIANNDVLALGLLGIANTYLFFQQPDLAAAAWFGPAAGLALFVVLFAAWMAGLIGAGDIKLLAIIPLVVGAHYLMLFGLLFLVLVAVNVFVLKGTILDGISQIQRYVEFFGGRGIIPFGVPISAAAIVVLVMQISTMLMISL